MDNILRLSNDGKRLIEVLDKSAEQITIPASVEVIWKRALDQFDQLQSIEVAAGNRRFASIDGILYNKRLTKLICVPGAAKLYKSLEDGLFSVPEGVKTIEKRAFYWRMMSGHRVSVHLPESVTKIGEGAFEGCKLLCSINIPDSVRKIEARTFALCYFLNRIDIAHGVEEIGNQAFYNCQSLCCIDIPASVTTIGEEAFADCESLQEIHMHYTSLKGLDIAEDAFESYKMDKCTLYVPAGTKWEYIEHPAFCRFKNIVEK